MLKINLYWNEILRQYKSCGQSSIVVLMQESNYKRTNICDECGSEYYRDTSQMSNLCPECSYLLYGYENCKHTFKDGRCIKCHWDGSKSHYSNKMAKMEQNDFYPFMKVSLNGECGVVTEEFYEANANKQQIDKRKLYGLIRWDTAKQPDLEDWRGLWGTFVKQGGAEIDKNHPFKFINDDGTSK